MKPLCTILIAMLITGCSRIEYGPQLEERADIVECCFVPSGHGSGTGLTSKGQAVFTSTTIPARYAVVFKCQHGKFIIEGEKAQRLYLALQPGDHVVVKYAEKFEVSKDSRVAVGLHFIDAVKEPLR